jgi:hypothetical protein
MIALVASSRQAGGCAAQTRADARAFADLRARELLEERVWLRRHRQAGEKGNGYPGCGKKGTGGMVGGSAYCGTKFTVYTSFQPRYSIGMLLRRRDDVRLSPRRVAELVLELRHAPVDLAMLERALFLLDRAAGSRGWAGSAWEHAKRRRNAEV